MVEKSTARGEQFLEEPETAVPWSAHPAPTLIIGLGNPILGDDGIGWQVAERVAGILSSRSDLPPAEVKCLSLGGLSLMEHLIGYERAILIDAVNLDEAPPGTLFNFPLSSLPHQAGSHLSSSHDTSLQIALKIGETMGAQLPSEIHVIGIQAINLYDFTEQLSEPVATALPGAVELVINSLKQGNPSDPPKE